MMFSFLESDLAAINKKHQILTDLNAKLESKYKTLRWEAIVLGKTEFLNF